MKCKNVQRRNDSCAGATALAESASLSDRKTAPRIPPFRLFISVLAVFGIACIALTCTAAAADIYLWQEGEGGALTSPMQVDTTSSASGGKYIWAPPQSGFNSNSLSNRGVAYYQFSVQEAGTYTLWARVYTPNPKDDSFWVQMDNGSSAYWSTRQSSSWRWVKAPSTYRLTDSSHSLKIRWREDGARLDKILLTNDPSFVPEGLGGNDSPDPTPTPTPMPTQTPTPGTGPYKAHTVPGRINFVDFDLGGEGVAYHDDTPTVNTQIPALGNHPQYRTATQDQGVDIGWRDAVGYVIGNGHTGEWLKYSKVQVETTGTYAATFYTSTIYTGRSISVLVDGEQAVTVNAPNTNSWETFAPTTVQIPLIAGEHTIQIQQDPGVIDLAYVEFEPMQQQTPTPTQTPTPRPTATPTPTPTMTPKPTPTQTPTPRPTTAPTEFYGAEPVLGSGRDVYGEPIGGGAGYTEIIPRNDPRVKSVVSTRSQLVSALANARAGDVVYVEPTANIDLTGMTFTPRLNSFSSNLVIPAGVTLASNRGENGSPGGRIYQERTSGDPSSGYVFCMITAGGANVRITGLRIDGPDHTTARMDAAQGGRRSGLGVPYKNVEIDNCEIYGFSGAGVTVRRNLFASGIHVHHNNIHHCQADGMGYGVWEEHVSGLLIESNYFNYMRHCTCGQGYGDESYEARYNIVGEVTSSQGGHSFDVHPAPDGSGYAGDRVDIHHNTVRQATDYAVTIRDVPRTGTYIHHNWFLGRYYVEQQNGQGKISMTMNALGSSRTISSSGPISYR